ncbi:NAD kinase 2, chloroplastic-like isoform X1 [Papaver somniferum]|uniref:NAD kinase 2, chloroplastic-like isoform X1 n=1 Tax=Papaver somniferum TaxID=3469 RepID=UPI000E705AA9|nr:NAD kinase 2, chloroplastic-like isoform X1 [Papaver somniferum]
MMMMDVRRGCASNPSSPSSSSSSASHHHLFRTSPSHPHKNNRFFEFGFHQQNKRGQNSSSGNSRFGVRASGELTSFFFSASSPVKIDLDTPETFQSQDFSQLSWVGPVPGDIAEVEAYCRIFRAAEQLHIALMETLCNPETGECSVTYDSSSESEEDFPLQEEKVVAVLGRMVALLNKGRADVLSGRSSGSSQFVTDVNISEGKVPPLAIFRAEMKMCSKSLHAVLKNYLRSSDNRSKNIWRKLQMLKNVCYDAGFPRAHDCPCQTLFANWAPVPLHPSKEGQLLTKGCEVAFWRGGQVIDEGLKWLVDRGFKVVVDLRAEVVQDDIYQAALEEAVSSGRIEVVKLPVEVGTAPSMDQVERFASLVANPDMKPLYLHSQEGVWRTSAMVSRWRQHMARSPSHLIDSKRTTRHTKDLDEDERGKGKDQSPSLLESENGAVEVGSLANFSADVDPLNAQFPSCDIFSKREMSSSFRNRNISPPEFFNYRRKKFEEALVSRKTGWAAVENSDIVPLVDPVSGLLDTGGPNGVTEEELCLKPQNVPINGKFVAGSDNYVSIGVDAKGYDLTEKKDINAKTQHSLVENLGLEKNGKPTTISKDRKGIEKDLIAPNDSNMEIFEGDMCASATGVVRVQSRKKAEMFLVRTDGHSCAREKVTESSLAFTHPSTQQQMLMWKSPPKTVLLLKKLGNELLEEAKEVASFLYYQEKMNVLVEPDVHDVFARIPGFGFIQTFYSQDTSDLHERVDFVACLGGDGVILHASNLFRCAVPPVVSFNLGSLGFLTSHTFEDFRQDLRQVIYGNNTLDGVYITLRMRLHCEIFRNGKAMPGKVFDVLNEVVVDRGSNPYLSKIECYERHRLITKVQGDGVIIATPTGSTAYSTAAGGSMVHPNVPCMLFTPICPHSLSFRPVILPDAAQLELKIPAETRSNAWVSFDGKRRQQLSRGDSVRICMSKHPLPTVNKSDQTCDWFHSLIRCLNWNERLDQKAL